MGFQVFAPCRRLLRVTKGNGGLAPAARRRIRQMKQRRQTRHETTFVTNGFGLGALGLRFNGAAFTSFDVLQNYTWTQ